MGMGIKYIGSSQRWPKCRAPALYAAARGEALRRGVGEALAWRWRGVGVLILASRFALGAWGFGS